MFLRKLFNSWSKDKLQSDVDDELAFHLEQRAKENRQNGMTDEEAHSSAYRRLGNLTLARERTAEADLFGWLECWLSDLRLSIRSLRKAPVFTLMTILSLSLGIGATTIVFTVTKQVVLDFLPVPQPERLVILHNEGVEEGHTRNTGIRSAFSYPLYRDMNAATGALFQGIVGRLAEGVTLAHGQESELVRCELVSGNYFDVLGVRSWRGRLLHASDDQRPGAHPVVVLSYGYWQRKFGSEVSVLGQTIRLNNHPFIIIGVAARGFDGLDLATPPAVFVPMMMKHQITPTWDGLADRLDHWCNLVARLAPGVTLEKAQARLNVIYPSLRKQDLPFIKSPGADFLKAFAKNHVALQAGGKGYSDVRETLRNPLRFLSWMVAILLLITIVNVANLLIARAASKRREIAIRMAVGAGKVALLRQLLVESLTLAALGGVSGLALTYFVTPVLLHFLSSDLSDSSIRAIPDWRIVAFASLVSVGAGLAFGLLPSWQAARTNVGDALKTESVSGHTGERYLLRRVLVASQVAFCLVLLSSALLFARSLRNLEHIQLGFDLSNLLTFKINAAGAGYSQSRIRAFAAELNQQLIHLSGVEGSGLVTVPIIEDTDRGTSITVEGYKPASHDDEEARLNEVSPGLFPTLKVPLLSGRWLADGDLAPNSKTALVNAHFAKHFFHGRSPLGAHFGFGSGTGVKMPWTIVGVVGDSVHSSLRTKIESYVYPAYTSSDELSTLTFYLRTRGRQESVKRDIQRIVHRYDSNLPVYDLRSMDETVAQQLFAERGLGLLSILFSALAILLALIGLYGVMAYAVARRRREFGVRMAIGATPRTILAMMLREAVVLGLIGVITAIPLVFAAGRAIQSSLYGVEANSPLLISIAASFLLLCLASAAFVPARRAARIDPQAALRSE